MDFSFSEFEAKLPPFQLRWPAGLGPNGTPQVFFGPVAPANTAKPKCEGVNTSSKFSTNGNQSIFLRLPAELRNHIYELTIPTDKVDINIRSVTPSITRVCQKIRRESLPIYYGNNTFLALVQNDSYNGLLDWLRSLRRQDLACLKKVAIARRGILVSHTPLLSAPESLEPNFSEWHTFIRELSNTGRKVSQMHWPGILDGVKSGTVPISHYFDTASKIMDDDDDTVTWLAIERYIFNQEVLGPLLIKYGLQDWRDSLYATSSYETYMEKPSFTRDEDRRYNLQRQEMWRERDKFRQLWASRGITPVEQYCKDMADERKGFQAAADAAVSALKNWDKINKNYHSLQKKDWFYAY